MLLSRNSNSNLALRKGIDNIPLQQFETGAEITVFDSGMWQVYRGIVQLSKISLDGREIIVGWVTSNGVFGNGLDFYPTSYRAIALSDVYIRHYTPQDIINYSLLAKQLLVQESDHLIKAQRLLAIISIRRVEERLKALLLELKQEIGQPTDDGIRLQVRFTHQHLAESIHTTRVTVTRTLGDFFNQGLIGFDKEKHIIIKDF